MPLVDHDHVPLYRVGRAGWTDQLDTSYSQRTSNRWNTPGGHRVLYTCCSVGVARCIVRDVFGLAAIDIDDLRPEYRPVLSELSWRGSVVDLASPEGVTEAGFPLSYPDRIEHLPTQPFAAAWVALGAEGVLCRSASVFRVVHRVWHGPHQEWAELAIFVDNASEKPELIRTRTDADWIT